MQETASQPRVAQRWPESPSIRRAGRLLWWVAPVLFLLWIDRYGLRTWFLEDDFAWLGLLREVHRSRTLLNALFAPEAQGTIRPWSERGFFMLFESLFGLDSLPFHLCIFATFAADSLLIGWITLRLTGSRVAGFLAPVLWIANANLSTPLAWSASYNEPLCALFLLAAMASFIRYAETGRRLFWWLQAVVFTLGFGALELNVVYPALAAAYVLCAGPRKQIRRLLASLVPLFAISIVYFLAHRAAAPLPADGDYAVHLDARIFHTFATYWHWSLIPEKWPGRVLRRGHLLFWLLNAGLLGFLAWQIARRRYTVVFFALWFAIALGPMLLLPQHLTDYYVTIALIGLSMWGAFAVAAACQAPLLGGVPALLLAGCYVVPMANASALSTLWWMDRSAPVRAVVLGAEAAERTHPGKSIVLDRVSSALYDDSIGSTAFYPAGLDYVYLTPGSEVNIHPTINPEVLGKVTIPAPVMKNALAHGDVVVYSVNGDHLRNITEAYERSAPERFPAGGNRQSDSIQEPRRVEVGNPLFAYLLGPEWFGLESGIRWMPRRAAVRLGGPARAGDKLVLEGYRPDPQLLPGVQHLIVQVDGVTLHATGGGGSEIGDTEIAFRRLFDIPPALAGRSSVEVVIAVDRVMRGPGGRELGLVFGTIAFEPAR